jgi:subfamily B ATP-binding cassette protein MsbA
MRGGFISQMPQGLDTEVGDNRVKSFGGQRQRVAIARAFLKNAPILIVEEATRALVSKSEREIQGALERLIVGRTMPLIAYHLSTIERADLTVALAHGRIVEHGRHAQPIARDGLYGHLHSQKPERFSEKEWL